MAERPRDEPSRAAGGEPPARDVSPWALAGLGLQFAVALVGFGYLGLWIDERFGCAPAGLLAGIFLGGGGTFYASYRRLMAPPTTPSARRGSPGTPR